MRRRGRRTRLSRPPLAVRGSRRRVRRLARATAPDARHAADLVEFYEDEGRGCRDFRKHIAWYLKGFPAGGTLRSSLALVDSLAALDRLLDSLDPNAPWPGDPAEGPRGRAGSAHRVVLPEGWLDSRDLTPEYAPEVAAAEEHHSGG